MGSKVYEDEKEKMYLHYVIVPCPKYQYFDCKLIIEKGIELTDKIYRAGKSVQMIVLDDVPDELYSMGYDDRRYNSIFSMDRSVSSKCLEISTYLSIVPKEYRKIFYIVAFDYYMDLFAYEFKNKVSRYMFLLDYDTNKLTTTEVHKVMKDIYKLDTNYNHSANDI